MQIAFEKNVAMTLPRRFYLPPTSHSDLPMPMTYFPFPFWFAVQQRGSDTSFRPAFCILSAFLGCIRVHGLFRIQAGRRQKGLIFKSSSWDLFVFCSVKYLNSFFCGFSEEATAVYFCRIRRRF